MSAAKTAGKPADKATFQYNKKVWTIDQMAFNKQEELEKLFKQQDSANAGKLTKQEFVGGNPKYTNAFRDIAADKKIGFATFWEHYRRYFFPNFRREQQLRKTFQELDLDNSKEFDADELTKVLGDKDFSKAEKDMIKEMHTKMSNKHKMTVEDFIEAWREVVRAQIEEQKKKYIKS